jgi:hypothetical protein
MCRLQFSSVAAEPGAAAPGADGSGAYDDDDSASCLEALLALRSGHQAQEEPELQYGPEADGEEGPVLLQQQEESSVAAAAAASQRYCCPYPGCKRSFAELWRLKVHFR